jgi:hypothetical protein
MNLKQVSMTDFAPAAGNTLWKFDAPQQRAVSKSVKSEPLNPQPVLFIPGHKGRVMQARSLNSYQHNSNGTFQYFATGFWDSHILSPYHDGSHAARILTHAAFVNQALRRIYALYHPSPDSSESPSQKKNKKKKNKKSSKNGKNKEQSGDDADGDAGADDGFQGLGPDAQSESDPKGKKDFKVIVVGHSQGGLVARTAMLLDNHPRCLVSTLWLLGAPNAQPAYPIDPSLDTLVRAVNAAWRGSHFNSSTLCKTANARRAQRQTDMVHRSSKRSFTAPATTTTGTGAEWDCPLCPARTRVVSITGGVTDDLVRPELTTLLESHPTRGPRKYVGKKKQKQKQKIQREEGEGDDTGLLVASTAGKEDTNNPSRSHSSSSSTSVAVDGAGEGEEGGTVAKPPSSTPSSTTSDAGTSVASVETTEKRTRKREENSKPGINENSGSGSDFEENGEKSLGSEGEGASPSATSSSNWDFTGGIFGNSNKAKAELSNWDSVRNRITQGPNSWGIKGVLRFVIVYSVDSMMSWAGYSTSTLAQSTNTEAVFHDSTDAIGHGTDRHNGSNGPEETDELWRAPFAEPLHYIARTAQLERVGFPVDHKALVWCHELLAMVTQGMHASRHFHKEPEPWTQWVPAETFLGPLADGDHDGVRVSLSHAHDGSNDEPRQGLICAYLCLFAYLLLSLDIGMVFGARCPFSFCSFIFLLS